MIKGLGDPKLANHEFVNFEMPNSGTTDDEAANGECTDGQSAYCQRA